MPNSTASNARRKSQQKPRSAVKAASTSLPAQDDLHHPWTFLTNHAHVLILLAREGALVLREVAQRVGITERAVQRIIRDLELGGYLQRERVGRKNTYKINPRKPLRHPIENHRTIGDLLALIEQRG
jgi:DNA-binding MarR family transcriptional regulator